MGIQGLGILKLLIVALSNLLVCFVCAKEVGEATDTPQAQQSASTMLVQYAAVDDNHKRDFDPYFLELLTLALEKSKVPFSLEAVATPVMVESRIERMLQKNPNMVHWLNSNSQKESSLIPIKIPLFKGLIGWRLLFIRKEDQAIFENIKSISDLAQYSAGLGHDWPDTKIFRDNGLSLVSSASWSGLFDMLRLKHIDYFPRSVIEIERELRLFPDSELYVDKALALQYPAAYYFFVNKANTELAKAIELGLLRAIEDGEFDLIFDKYFSDILFKSDFKTRRIIKLHTEQEFPFNTDKFWYTP